MKRKIQMTDQLLYDLVFEVVNERPDHITPDIPIDRYAPYFDENGDPNALFGHVFERLQILPTDLGTMKHPVMMEGPWGPGYITDLSGVLQVLTTLTRGLSERALDWASTVAWYEDLGAPWGDCLKISSERYPLIGVQW